MAGGTCALLHCAPSQWRTDLLRVDDSGADLNLRRYDHPSTYVFRKTGEPRLFAERPDLAMYSFATWEDCLAVLERALALNDLRIFQMVFTREVKKKLNPETLEAAFKQFKEQPQLLRTVQRKAAFVEDDGTWRLNVVLE